MKRGPFARGDIVWMSLDPQKGREQAGTRPALVISATSYNKKSDLMLVCPITSKAQDWPFAVALPEDGAFTGAILVDHVRSVDWRVRRPAFAGRCQDDALAEAVAKLKVLIQA